MHLYIDTSDLNAPYDQWRGARPLQGIGAANHVYMDYSNLNAQYDRARPAIHGLGGGSVSDIQGQLGVPNTNEWDHATLAALSRFQGKDGGELKMHVTGVPDPATLINLGYYDPMDELPRKQAQYLAGGRDQPTTLWRDTATLSNQVPQWVWVVTGVALSGFGYWVYRRKKKLEKGTA